MSIRDYWNEIEPIAKHGVAAGAIVAISAVFIRLIKLVLPTTYAADLQRIDHLLVLVAVMLFGINMLAILAVRIYFNLVAEIRRRRQPPLSGSQSADEAPATLGVSRQEGQP